jgi:hypothetical protein
MEERLLLDGVQVYGARIAINQGVILSLAVFPHAAFPPLPILHLALPGAELATHQTLGQGAVV